MPMKTPPFWYQEKLSLVARLLLPASWIYRAGRWLHCAFTAPKPISGVHVICVGNVNAGGSGKTPSVRALMDIILRKKLAAEAAFLLRGYGSKVKKPLLVDVNKHSAADVGEEALMLASLAPVYVSPNRRAGVLAVKKAGFDVVVMDDGLQNRSIKADTNIMVVDSVMRFGNQRLIPAGPLREALSAALSRVHASIVIGGDQLGLKVADEFSASIVTPQELVPDRRRGYIAFAGIGYPDKFFNYLRALGVNVQEVKPFPDHHKYSRRDLDALLKLARKNGAVLVTTEKDYMHIQPLLKSGEEVAVLPIVLEFRDEARISEWLSERLLS